MDVIGAGFGRTGTLSLKAALEQLGFGPCMHMLPLLGDVEKSGLFLKAAGGDADSLDAALDGCRATVDWPGAFFWRELAARHPSAKVILTVRDPQKWYDSAAETIYQAASAPRDPGSPLATCLEMVDATVWEGTFHGRFADREAAIKIFEEHNIRVRREIPAARLLEFDVKQGWEPLCAFLEVPVPDAPFPHLNDAAEFKARLTRHA